MRGAKPPGKDRAMPKARESKTLSDDGRVKRIQVEVGQRDETKLATYDIPSNAQVFQDMVKNANAVAPEGEESELDKFYRYHKVAVERYAKAAVYESIAAASTYITVGKDRINLLDFPVEKFVVAFNGMLGSIAAKVMLLGDDKEAQEKAEANMGFGPWRAAATKHAAVADANGAPVKPKVKMLDNGTLELLPA